MLDIDALLEPIAGPTPCGEDLEYDPEWQELERLSLGKPEQQFGDTVIPAEEPDWREVAEKSEALLARSKDVRNAVLLARAQVHLNHFAGLADGLQLIHRLMSQYWDEIHPQLDAEDDNDPTMRLNALAALADPQGLLRDARAAKLFQSRAHGELTVRQIELCLGKVQPRQDETPPDESQLELQLSAVVAENPNLPIQVSATLTAARELAQLLDEKVGSDRSPDLKSLIASLLTVDQMVGRVSDNTQEIAEEAGSEGSPSAPAAGSGGGASAASGAIRSREDVMKLLDKMSEYLLRTEPTNPVPLLLQRAKRIMKMNFVEVMNEIAPDGLVQAQTVVGGASAAAEAASEGASESSSGWE